MSIGQIWIKFPLQQPVEVECVAWPKGKCITPSSILIRQPTHLKYSLLNTSGKACWWMASAAGCCWCLPSGYMIRMNRFQFSFSDIRIGYLDQNHPKIRGPQNRSYPIHPKILSRWDSIFWMNHFRILRSESSKNPRPTKSTLFESSNYTEIFDSIQW